MQGCHALFRCTFDEVIAKLSDEKVLAPNSDAAKRALALAAAKAAPRPPPVPGLPPPPPPVGMAEDADAAAEACGANLGEVAVEAFASLAVMLASAYDDVASSAAQSIAALSAAARVRAALGKHGAPALKRALALQSQLKAAAAAFDPGAAAHARQASAGSTASSASSTGGAVGGFGGAKFAAEPPPAPSPTAAGAPRGGAGAAPPPSPPPGMPPSDTIVLQIFDMVLKRADGRLPSSVECRTACAIAAAQLASDPLCREVLTGYHAALFLIGAARAELPTASAAALRRECLRAAAVLMDHDSGAREVATRFRPHALRSLAKSIDAEFDTLAEAIAAKLEAAALRV